MKIRFIFKILSFIGVINLLSFSSFATTHKCYISFSSKGGIGTMEKQEVIKGTTIRLNPCTFTKDGYYFSCWEDDFGKTYKDQDYIVVKTDVRLSAKWSKTGDSNDPNVVTLKKDDDIISKIVEYQKLRGLDETIKPNTWYTVGTNLWYLIGSDNKPVKGWYKEKNSVNDNGTNRDSGVVSITTMSEPERRIVADGKNNYIVAPTNNTKQEPVVSPSNKNNVVNKKEEENKINESKSRWYYLDPDTCLLILGWKVIDQKYYYFATETKEADMVFDKVSGQFVSNGYDKELGQMYADEYTPDGRYVDKNGVMVNQYR